jgi:hypothetical protein
LGYSLSFPLETKTVPIQQSRKVFAAVALLLAIMTLLSGGAALQESVTVDEVAHIGAGLSYLQKLGLRMNLKHPPLAKVSDFGMGISQLCA